MPFDVNATLGVADRIDAADGADGVGNTDLGQARRFGSQTFWIVGVVLAGFAFLGGRTRRIALFYFVAGALYLGLALQADLYDLYRELPGGALFRRPLRFLWVVAMSLSVLVPTERKMLTPGMRKRPWSRWSDGWGSRIRTSVT